MPEVVALYMLTGGFDLALWAVFTDDEHLQDFLLHRLGKIPGILHSQTTHVLSVFKHSYEWVMPDPEQHSVLVVDDDPDFVEMTRLVLTAEGYAVRTASSGDEAMRSMIANPPSLVILDVMMQGVLDGWDTSARISESPGFHDTPVLMVSSITDSDYRSMVPTDDDHLIGNFLSKPVSPRRLVEEVARLIAMRS